MSSKQLPSAPTDLPTFATTPTSRSYLHLACGGVTVVGDWAFEAICNPLNDPGVKTMCSACGRYAPLIEFKWADTGENIIDYHERLRPLLSPFARFTNAITALGLLALPLAGAIVAIWIKGSDTGHAWTIGLIIGAAIAVIALVLVQRLPRRDFRQYI